MTSMSILKEIKRSEKPTVYLDSNLFGLMIYLHKKYGNIEWSGYIYYSQEGDINDPANLKFHVNDFAVLDVGTSGRTEVDFEGDQMAHILDSRPEILEGKVKQGLMHTHHSMSTFFSGTDTDTLLESALQFPIFLSIITNFKLDVIAKISTKGKTLNSSTKYDYVFVNNRYIIKEVPDVTLEEDCVYTFDCNIKIRVNSKFEKDVELTNKYYEDRKTKSKLAFNDLPGMSYGKHHPVRQFEDVSERYRFKGNKHLTPIDEVDQQLCMFHQESKEETIETFTVLDFVIMCILLDSFSVEYSQYTIESALQETLSLYKTEEDSYRQELTDMYSTLFNLVFENEIQFIKKITDIEREITNIVNSNDFFSKPDCKFIKVSLLHCTSTYCNSLRKELVQQSMNTQNKLDE